MEARTGERRILVVDDEPSIVDAVATSLRYEGFDVVTAANGEEALTAVAIERPELIVLDVMMPKLDGFAVAKRLRGDHLRTPIIFLTAKDSTEDKVTGLTIGGDDYVTKPFALAELIARVRAVLARSYGAEDDGVLRVADLELDERAHEVRRNGTEVQLTATEFALLRYLMLNPRQVLSKAQILDHVWSYDFEGDANVVETYISYLRRKLDALGPSLIHTVRLVGYVLKEPSA